MPDPVCYYDDPYDYNSDVYWNGACPPAPLPVEVPFVLRGKSEKRTKKIYCCVDIDTMYCYVNGELVSQEKISAKKIRHVSEEDEENRPQFLINRIGYTQCNTFDSGLQQEWVVEHIEAQTQPTISPTEFKVDSVAVVMSIGDLLNRKAPPETDFIVTVKEPQKKHE